MVVAAHAGGGDPESVAGTPIMVRVEDPLDLLGVPRPVPGRHRAEDLLRALLFEVLDPRAVGPDLLRVVVAIRSARTPSERVIYDRAPAVGRTSALTNAAALAASSAG